MSWKKVPKILKIKKYLFFSKIDYYISIKAVSSAVEHLPYKQMATGSNPVPPSENPLDFGHLFLFSDFGPGYLPYNSCLGVGGKFVFYPKLNNF